MMNNEYDNAYDKLCELSGEDVLKLFMDYHGTDILYDDDFMDYLHDEGVLDYPDVWCASCGCRINGNEYNEACDPTCHDCGEPLCPECLTHCSDENDRCPTCAALYEEEVQEDVAKNNEALREEVNHG